MPGGNARWSEEPAELRDGVGRTGRLLLAGLGLLWLFSAWVCLSSRSPELLLGWLSLATGLLLVVTAPFLPRARLRGSVLRSGWGTGSCCDLARISAARLSVTRTSGGELMGLAMHVSDSDGGHGWVPVQVRGSSSALAATVARHILDSAPDLSDGERTTLRSVADGLSLRPPFRQRFALLFLVGLVVATGWVATTVYEEWTLARSGTPVASTVTSVKLNTTLRGNQSTSLCAAPQEAEQPSIVGSPDGLCLKVSGAARFAVGNAITLRVDPTDPDRVVIDGMPPSDLGFLAFLVAWCASMTFGVVALRRLRMAAS